MFKLNISSLSCLRFNHKIYYTGYYFFEMSLYKVSHQPAAAHCGTQSRKNTREKKKGEIKATLQHAKGKT